MDNVSSFDYEKYRAICKLNDKASGKYTYKSVPITRKDWHDAYSSQIEDLYNIMIKTVRENYPNNRINWDDNRKINNFSKLLYNSSSKYITPYN